MYIGNFVFYVPSDKWFSTFGKLKFSIGNNNIVFKAITVDNPVIHQLLVSRIPHHHLHLLVFLLCRAPLGSAI